jgi:penicillin-binding protein-related factor A (putative recombinase)
MTKEELFKLLMTIEDLPNWDTYDYHGLDNGIAIWFDTKETEEEE